MTNEPLTKFAKFNRRNSGFGKLCRNVLNRYVKKTPDFVNKRNIHPLPNAWYSSPIFDGYKAAQNLTAQTPDFVNSKVEANKISVFVFQILRIYT